MINIKIHISEVEQNSKNSLLYKIINGTGKWNIIENEKKEMKKYVYREKSIFRYGYYHSKNIRFRLNNQTFIDLHTFTFTCEINNTN